MNTRRPQSSSGDAVSESDAVSEGDAVSETPTHTPDDSTTIEQTLALVGDKWSILLLRAAFRGISRFDDFCADLGIARPILAARLRKLVKAGLMVKVPYQDHPPRYEYKLTEMGSALSPAIVALVRWGDQYLSTGAPPTLLVHAPCGTELEQGFWCNHCGTTFGPSAIRGVPSTD